MSLKTRKKRVERYRANRRNLVVGGTFRHKNHHRYKGIFTITGFQTTGKYTHVDCMSEKGEDGWHFELGQLRDIKKPL